MSQEMAKWFLEYCSSYNLHLYSSYCFLAQSMHTTVHDFLHHYACSCNCTLGNTCMITSALYMGTLHACAWSHALWFSLGDAVWYDSTIQGSACDRYSTDAACYDSTIHGSACDRYSTDAAWYDSTIQGSALFHPRSSCTRASTVFDPIFKPP